MAHSSTHPLPLTNSLDEDSKVISVRSYGDFSSSIHRHAVAQRIPLSGTIEVTHRCPLTCAHCYNNLPMADASRLDELSLEDHHRIVDEIVEAGCMWLLYTGGEIFARKDFLDIYTYARKKGLFITLFTNGTLINKRIAEHLAQWRPFAIEITLYGYSEASYEELTGIKGSYARCLRGIQWLLEHKLPLKLKTVATQTNQHEIAQMQAWVQNELGLEFKLDGMINPRINLAKNPLQVRLSAEQLVAFDWNDEKRRAEWSEFAERFIGPVNTPDKADRIYSCGGGRNAFAISPTGGLSICVLSQKDVYDLRQGSFQDGWEHFLGKVRDKRKTKVTKCSRCQIKSVCGMCPANGELENNNPEEPVDFLCQVAHLRALTMGWQIPEHGECEYCEGGIHHRRLLQSVQAIHEGKVSAQQAKFHLRTLSANDESSLNSSSCSTGGCGCN